MIASKTSSASSRQTEDFRGVCFRRLGKGSQIALVVMSRMSIYIYISVTGILPDHKGSFSALNQTTYGVYSKPTYVWSSTLFSGPPHLFPFLLPSRPLSQTIIVVGLHPFMVSFEGGFTGLSIRSIHTGCVFCSNEIGCFGNDSTHRVLKVLFGLFFSSLVSS